MEELEDKNSSFAHRMGTSWQLKSKKDQAGFRLKRETFSEPTSSSDTNEKKFWYDDSIKNINPTDLISENFTPNFRYDKTWLEKDIYYPFIYKQDGKTLSQNDYGPYPVSAIPPSLRQTLGRFGKNKLQRGYSYQDRIGIYTNSTYFKILFVRHPIERLLSAYRDKAQPAFFKYRSGLGTYKSLRELLRKDLDPEDFAEKATELDRSAFIMFLTYVIERGGENSGWAGITVRHWGRSYDLCRVCSVDWDFIGKMDSVEADSEKVMELLGLKDQIHLGLHPPSNDHTKVIKYFKGLSRDMLMGVYQTYEADFQVLGYTIPQWLWEATVDDK